MLNLTYRHWDFGSLLLMQVLASVTYGLNTLRSFLLVSFANCLIHYLVGGNGLGCRRAAVAGAGTTHTPKKQFNQGVERE